MGSRPAIPQPTIARLAIYLRDLRAALKEGVKTLSSAEIERRTGISSGQVRKDLSYFGEFGKPGRGYEVATLVGRLSGIMGLDRSEKARDTASYNQHIGFVFGIRYFVYINFRDIGPALS